MNSAARLSLFQAAFVVARRDFVAVLFSRAFFFFLLGPLFPILVGSGAGSEVMSRIAAPMIGGMLTAPLLSMLVIPAAYLLMRRKSQPNFHPEGEVK